MEEEFSSGLADTRVLIRDVSIPEALQFKQELKAIDGVTDVMWLDDAYDVKEPLEMADESLVETYYKEGDALFIFGIREGEEVAVTDEIYELIGEENSMAGEALNTAVQQKMTFQETLIAASILVPIIIIILILSTTSWMEPVFFLAAIGVSVLINLGTNIFLGEVSFVTQAVAPILQLAVSLDYAIFLLHSFADYREETPDVKEAMRLAIKRSFPAIVASASTTFFGFMALSFMNFEIGSDLGLNLVKGIALSFISVMVFLPALTVTFYKWIDKTQHRPLLPRFNKVGQNIIKLRLPVLLLVLLLIVPAFLAQSKTDFTYGFGEQPESTRSGKDIAIIDEAFGKNSQLVALVPRGEVAKEERLVQSIEDLPHVTSVLAYVNAVGSVIPDEFLEESMIESFYSENYSRFIIQTNTDLEGDLAFTTLERIQVLLEDTYENDTHILGETATLFDMKDVIEKDNKLVNILTVVTIMLVLFVTFRSLTYPVILLLTIQASVWINLSVPYFTQSPLVYIGYLIISTVQLAATVDYAILLSEDYTIKRQSMPAKEAIVSTINEKTYSIAVSASILSSVGFILWLTSTNPIVAAIGLLLGRGALLAFLMVLFLLPGLLILLDKVIEKTTWKANFFKGDDDETTI
ncbi:MAG TPA: MMPL family transporter [Pseudogracilibacillus sp.]|nr:MMPL family transporter [Pseudogracilibacillus sp.]